MSEVDLYGDTQYLGILYLECFLVCGFGESINYEGVMGLFDLVILMMLLLLRWNFIPHWLPKVKKKRPLSFFFFQMSLGSR